MLLINPAAGKDEPITEVAWHFGMGELHADIEWDSETTNQVDIVPNKELWLAATQVPLTMIVGLNDTAVIPESLRPGQRGKIRYIIARNWIADMALFAEENGLQSQFELELIPGQGHTMSGMLPFSQDALLTE